MSELADLFESNCVCCDKIVKTKTDQKSNPKFVCGKACRAKLAETQKSILLDRKYGVKVIPKYSNHYIPSIVLYFLPQYLFQNDVRCDKCYSRFYSDDIPESCNVCINNTIPVDTNCVTCNKTYSSTPYKIKQKNNMCTDCFNIKETDFICDICRCKFIDTHKTYNDLNASICKMCRVSNHIRQRYLHNYQNNETINKLLDIGDKKIKIYYKIYDETHNGYCSDHDSEDYVTETYTEEKIFPLMNEFTDISDINKLMDSDKFHFYYTLQNKSNCGLGCSQKKYEIINYEFI